MNHKRVLLGFILVVLLFLLMLYSSLEHDRYDPDIEYMLANFEKYNNTKITFTGEIIETNTTSQTLTVQVREPPYSSMEMTIGAAPL